MLTSNPFLSIVFNLLVVILYLSILHSSSVLLVCMRCICLRLEESIIIILLFCLLYAPSLMIIIMNSFVSILYLPDNKVSSWNLTSGLAFHIMLQHVKM